MARGSSPSRGSPTRRRPGSTPSRSSRPRRPRRRACCAVARRREPTAIACGASGRGGLARTVLGTTTDALLQRAPVPVLVVPEDDAPADGPLLVGYDRSEAARAAVADAAALFPGRRALVVHAWSSPVRRSYAGELLLASPVDEVQQLARSLDDIYAADAEEAAEEGAAFAREHKLDASPLVVAVQARRLARARRRRDRGRRGGDRGRLARARRGRGDRARLRLLRACSQRAAAGAGRARRYGVPVKLQLTVVTKSGAAVPV